VQVSLSGAEDIRLMRVVLPSPDPATSLGEAARQLGLPQSESSTPRSNSVDDLYQAERGLLAGYAVIPLFHLPVASAAGARVRGWTPGPLATWSDAGSPLSGIWLETRAEAGTR